MTSLELFLLGPIHVKLDGAYIEVKPRKALALLVYLAVTAERHSRDALATLLWPESSQRNARKSLRSRLSELNLALGGEWIEADGESVGLRAGYWEDVAEFQQALANKAESTQSLMKAADLYRDDFMTGFTLPDCPEFDEWQFFQAESLRQSLATVLEELIQKLSEQREYEEAISYGRRWLALDRLHEPAHRELMLLYVQSGQQAAALRQFDRCRQTLEAELGIVPSQETRALYQDIQAGNLKRRHKQPRPQHNLPIQTSTFIGREHEVADIKKMLLEDDGCRFLTLVGPGGIGKTRLALATAAQFRDAFPNGVFFVPLAPVSEPELIVQAIAESLRLTFYGNVEPKEQLLGYLSRRQLLLIVDNLEHLLDGTTVLSDIVSQASAVSILATSRERLNLQEEWVFDVRGLDFPTDGSRSLTAYSATELFLQRARQVKADFTPTEEEMADIGRICQLVEGMPLAIELAAPWIKVLSCREIAAEIERNLDFLETTVHNVPDRHRSLRVVFEQTWERLSEQEKSVLRRLSVFRGGCTREAVEQIAGATLPVLSSLVDKALLRRSNTGRYELHELIRQFAEGELGKIETAETIHDLHCAYFADFLYQHERDFKGPRQKEAADEIVADFENVLRAWNWAVKQTHVDLLEKAMGSLGHVHEWAGRYQEGEQAFAHAADKLAKTETAYGKRILANLLIWQAIFGELLGKNNKADRLLSRAQSLLKTPKLVAQDTRKEQVAILIGLGRVAYNNGDLQNAGELYEQSLTLYRNLGDRWGEARALLAVEGVGRNYLESGDPNIHIQQTEASKKLVLESLAIFRDLEDLANIARSSLVLGSVFFILGQATDAQIALEQCIAICKRLGQLNNYILNSAVGNLGLVKGWYFGLYERMRREGQNLLALSQDLGSMEGEIFGLGIIGLAALAQGKYKETQQIYQELVVSGHPRGGRTSLASHLAVLGYATRQLGQKNQSRQHLSKSLQISREINAVQGALYGLPLAALLMMDQGELERAMEVQALAWSFPVVANSRLLEEIAGQHLLTVASTFPSTVVAAAQERGRTRDLWTTIEELLPVFADEESDGDSLGKQ